MQEVSRYSKNFYKGGKTPFHLSVFANFGQIDKYFLFEEAKDFLKKSFGNPDERYMRDFKHVVYVYSVGCFDLVMSFDSYSSYCHLTVATNHACTMKDFLTFWFDFIKVFPFPLYVDTHQLCVSNFRAFYDFEKYINTLIHIKTITK